MPEISRFLGIIISMYYSDHGIPHFHVEYNDYEASISINDIALLGGNLPPRIFGLVSEWAIENKTELLEDWNLAKEKQKLKKIKPLV